MQERFLRLTALQDRIAHEENQAQVGRTVEVLVAEAEGRKDGATHRVTGRAADNRLVHLALPAGGGRRAPSGRPGDRRPSRTPRRTTWWPTPR